MLLGKLIAAPFKITEKIATAPFKATGYLVKKGVDTAFDTHKEKNFAKQSAKEIAKSNIKVAQINSSASKYSADVSANVAGKDQKAALIIEAMKNGMSPEEAKAFAESVYH